MPKKIRELKQILRRAGFLELLGKGSHTNWIHPNYTGKLTISGQDGSDAKRYQEKDVIDAVRAVKSNLDMEKDDEIESN
jgi:predicted RNA binding protein YcfA (HicA-like mRNA interferase family)